MFIIVKVMQTVKGCFIIESLHPHEVEFNFSFHGLYVQAFFEKYLTRIIRLAILNVVHIEVIV